MINLILLLLIVHYINYIIYKPKGDTLNCGIFAWAGKSTNKFNKSLFDILGMFNDERGGHSCGVAIDGDIFPGVESNKLYKNFIINNKLEMPKGIPIVIGHTRKATYGRHTIENAHPFGFGNIKQGENSIYRFIGVHNGTILNFKELAENFNVSKEAKTDKRNSREKIDSEIVLEAIYRNKNWKVLEEYNGAAALVFQNLKEPNVIYCYHGASKKQRNDSDGKKYIERPLFYWKQTRNSLYISSIEESLTAIGGTEETIGEFKTNLVYKITDGNIDKAETFSVNRDDNFINKTYNFSSNYRIKKQKPKQLPENTNNNSDINLNEEDYYYHQGCQTHLFEDKLINAYSNSTTFNIYNEKIELPVFKNQAVFNRFRYWSNDKLLNGIYTYLPKFGFYYLGDKLKSSEEHFWLLCGKYFYNGEFDFNADTFKAKTGSYIPLEKDILSPKLFYFFKGINIETHKDYNIIKFHNVKDFTIEELSYCSVHPIIDINTAIKVPADRQSILYKGNLFDDIICPLGSDKIYTIERGNCSFYAPKKYINDKEEKKEEKSEAKVVTLNTLNEVTKTLRQHEENISKAEDKLKNSDIDIMNELIEEVFKSSLLKFPEAIKRLDPFTNHIDAVSTIAILEDFLDSARQVIDIEPN